MQIKFQTHYVTNGKTKASCKYHAGQDINGRLRVTIYAKDYGHTLGAIIEDGYENHTDTQTDYFDKGRVTLYPEHPLYAAALERAEKNHAAFELRWAALQQKRRERYAARHGLQGLVVAE